MFFFNAMKWLTRQLSSAAIEMFVTSIHGYPVKDLHSNINKSNRAAVQSLTGNKKYCALQINQCPQALIWVLQ